MTDHTTPSGAGLIMIRDLGSTVQFLVQAGSSSTFANGKTWSATGAGSGTFNYPTGAPLLLIASATITTSQNVTFNMGATGTSGLGGPTSLTVFLNRATVPGAPNISAWSNIGIDRATINFTSPASNGGAAIDYYLVRYGKTNPPESGTYVEFTTGTGLNPRTGLDPGSTYYARVYAHNSQGYGASSAIVSVLTLAPVHVKVGGHYKYAVPYVKVAGVYKAAQPYVKVAGVYKKTG